MTNDQTEHGALKGLLDTVADAKNGYEEAVKVSQNGDHSSAFQTMLALHTQNAVELEQLLASMGTPAREPGTFMSSVNRMVVDARNMFTGLDGSLQPFIDGELMILKEYDRSLALLGPLSASRGSVERQRDTLAERIEMLARISPDKPNITLARHDPL